MIIRNGFVSNSSSSSFVLPKYKLNDNQIYMIKNCIDIAKKIDKKLIEEGKEPKYEWYKEWNISEDDISILLATSMDNFDLKTFIQDEIGLKLNDIILFEDDFWDVEDIFTNQKYIDYKNEILRSKKIKKILFILNNKNLNNM